MATPKKPRKNQPENQAVPTPTTAQPLDSQPSAASATAKPAAQPKINQRMQLRYAVTLLTIAALFFAWYFLRDVILHPDFGSVDTTGWVLALKETPTGTQAVAIKSDGSILENPQPTGPIQDRDPTWQPDGQRIFFSSNRDEKLNAFHMYRWNPASNRVEQQTTGSRAQQRPIFDLDQPQISHPTALIISGGFVVEFDPHDGSTKQVLPLVGKGVTQDSQEAGGASSQFGPEYEHFGTSFKEASWYKGRKYIVAVMRRDEGETLIIQNMQPDEGHPEQALPVGIVAGDHVQFAIDTKSGYIVYTVQNFDFVDKGKLQEEYLKDGKDTAYVKNGKLVKPYKHVIGMVDPEKPDQSGPILISPDDKVSFGSPTPSPDGSTVLFVAGPYDSAMVAKALIVTQLKPFDPHAPSRPTPLLQGSVSSPSWSPDGQNIAFIMTSKSGSRDVFTMKANGDQLKDLTEGKGFNFESAVYSPAITPAKPAGS